MKFYGKSFGEVLRMMPFMHRLAVVVGLLFILYALFYIPYALFTVDIIPDERPGPIEFSSKTEIKGFFDPSIAFVKNGKSETAVMAFSAAKPAQGKTPAMTEVRLAESRSSCKEWRLRPGGFASKAEEILGPDNQTPVASGVWRAETPSIVYDPADKGREWKLYAYRYFWSGSAPLARLYSMIVYAYAPEPGIKWSTEEWLFSASTGAPPSPYGDIVRMHLNDLSPELADVYFYSRPSVIELNGDLLMALSAYVEGKDTPDRIILIGSGDHGKSWKYLGSPLKSAEAAHMGNYTKISGATLLKQDKGVYLAAVLGDEKVGSKGTIVIPFIDPVKALLKRNSNNGAPVASVLIPQQSFSPTATGGGFAAYHEKCDSGIITAEWSGLRKDFTLFKTLKNPDGSEKK